MPKNLEQIMADIRRMQQNVAGGQSKSIDG